MACNYIKCPICSSGAIDEEFLRGDQILTEIRSNLPDLPKAEFSAANYKILRCEQCTFVFSDPMLPGDDRFYDWICKSKYYYPSIRWEWAPSIDFLKRRHAERILDVGCGSGLFLEELKKGGLNGIGIDLNQASVEACRQKGLSAECLSLEDLENSGFAKFEAITLFHVLEHISDPVHAIYKLRNNLARDGIIAVSVPHSPMSFETDWRDPLNRPPHHLTRWNVASLRALARAVGLKERILVQPSRNALSRTLSTLQLIKGLSPITAASLFQRSLCFGARVLRWPALSAGIFFRQRKRDVFMGGAKGDAVLMLMWED